MGKKTLGTVTEQGNQDAQGGIQAAKRGWYYTSSLHMTSSLGSVSWFSFLQEKFPRISCWPRGGRTPEEGGKRPSPTVLGTCAWLCEHGRRNELLATLGAQQRDVDGVDEVLPRWGPGGLQDSAKVTSPESAQLGLSVPGDTGAARREKETTSLERDGSGVLPSTELQNEAQTKHSTADRASGSGAGPRCPALTPGTGPHWSADLRGQPGRLGHTASLFRAPPPPPPMVPEGRLPKLASGETEKPQPF